MAYVVAISSPRMGFRIKHRDSEVFLSTLNKFQDQKFPFMPSSPLDAAQSRCDSNFLSVLATLNVNVLLSRLKVKIPNLLAEVVAASQPRTHTFYNEKTAREFHRLLVALLDEFSRALASANRIVGTSWKELIAITGTKIEAQNKEIFWTAIDHLALCGICGC
jgi:hypothetical protein